MLEKNIHKVLKQVLVLLHFPIRQWEWKADNTSDNPADIRKVAELDALHFAWQNIQYLNTHQEGIQTNTDPPTSHRRWKIALSFQE